MLDPWLLIGSLAVLTYISRIIGLRLMAGREMNAALRSYFGYVPVGIIAALIIKQILTPTGGQAAVSYPVLAGCLATAITIKTIKLFLPSVMIGVFIGWLTRYWIG